MENVVIKSEVIFEEIQL